jgi:uncharacterized protein (UPF0333 family)
MQKKGQVAFESIILMLVILTAAIAITSYYTQTHPDTLAISTAKTEALRQINLKNETTTIDYVQIIKTINDTNINIKTTPKTELDTTLIKKEIEKKTKYTNLIINLE